MNTATLTKPLVQGLAWSANNTLIAIDEDIVDKRIRRKALSASTSKSMKGCLARFAGEKTMPREDDPFADSTLGTETHALHEHLYNLPAKERTIEMFHKLKLERADALWTRDTKEESIQKFIADMTDDEIAECHTRWIENIDRLGLGEFKIQDPRETVVYKNELGFDGVKIAGVPAMGFIDRVEIITHNGKEYFKVVDLKTGKMKSAYERNLYGDDHGDQIRLYHDALNAYVGEKPLVGTINYTQFGESRDVEFTEAAFAATRREFRKSWDTHNKVMEAGEFPTSVGPLCGWCPLVNSCPAAAAAGKTDMTGTDKVNGKRVHVREGEAPSAVALGIPTVRAGVKPLGSKLPATDPVTEESDAEKVQRIVSASVVTDPYADLPYFDAAAPAADPAHEVGVTVNQKKEVPMSAPIISEGKPWDEKINGNLNGASYTATAVMSLPQMAGELLFEAGKKITGPAVDAITDMLANILMDIQRTFRGGTFAWDDGINTRLRGALRTTLETMPLPWDATDVSEWEAWQAAATKRTGVFIAKGIALWEKGENISAPNFAALINAAAVDAAPAAPSPATVARRAA